MMTIVVLVVVVVVTAIITAMKITRTKVSVGEKKKLGVKPTFWYVDQEHFFENE